MDLIFGGSRHLEFQVFLQTPELWVSLGMTPKEPGTSWCRTHSRIPQSWRNLSCSPGQPCSVPALSSLKPAPTASSSCPSPRHWPLGLEPSCVAVTSASSRANQGHVLRFRQIHFGAKGHHSTWEGLKNLHPDENLWGQVPGRWVCKVFGVSNFMTCL